MSLNYDDIDLGHVARTKDLSDGERMLTLMLSQLDELEYHINNALGHAMGDAKKVERKKPKGQKISDGEIFGVQHADKDNSLSNKQLPRYAAKPNDVVTIPKPKVRKSRDYTGSSLSKEEPKPTPEDWEDEDEVEPEYDPETGEEVESEPEPEIDYEGEDYFKRSDDADKFLPLATAVVATRGADEENPNDPDSVLNMEKAMERQLGIEFSKAIDKLKEVIGVMQQVQSAENKEARTTAVPQSKVNVPQDKKPGKQHWTSI